MTFDEKRDNPKNARDSKRHPIKKEATLKKQRAQKDLR
jgi:hypothetical protein